MKKFAGILILILLYAGAAFYTGYQGEKNIRQQIAAGQQQAEVQGLKLELNRYERGVFFSDIEFTATYPTLNFSGTGLTITSKSRVQHGPLLLLGKVGVGLFSSVSTFEVRTGDAEIDQRLIDIFGESIGEIVTLGHFNNRYTATWTVPAIEFSQDGDVLKVEEIRLTIEGGYTNMDSEGSVNIGAMDFAMADGTHITTTPITGTFDVTSISPAVNISNSELVMANMSFRNAAMMSGAAEQVKVVQTQKLVNGKVDTFVSFSAAKINGPLEITNLHYDITLNQLDPVAIQKWTELAASMQAADPQGQLEDGAVTELVSLVLQEGLHSKVAIGAEFMEGSAKVDWVADYRPLTDGRQVKDIIDPADYLLLVDSDMVISISESIVMQTPLMFMLGQYMDSYIQQEGDKYVMHATLKNGVLKVGNTELPNEVLLAMLPVLNGTPAQPAFDDTEVHDHQGE